MKGQIMYSIVVPVYNEEEVIQVTYRRLTEVMERTEQSYELIFVNDGSQDRTMDILTQAALIDASVRVIDFSRNFGHQIAITAGMDAARGQAIIVIDADLQDPPELILEMIELWNQGYDVVYAKRRARAGETLFKRMTASCYYRVLKGLTKIDIPEDTGDFRLIDHKVNDAMKTLQEKNRFVRGLVSWVGFRQIQLEYDRKERLAGQTKYPLRKMIRLSVDGVTSFSDKPLKMASYAGIVISGISFVSLVVTICLKLFTDNTVAGWASIVSIILLMNGIILLLLGVMGEYIGRIYDESRGRPLYIVRERVGFNSQPLSKEEKLLDDSPQQKTNFA
ncbi:glycosyltransferase family 2 protein [Paenibacillus sp. Marseille-Q4541]|uniref:glycosyltransferase family 2 protein n=1 Tax=Paenibacillus sp. Marseille-Q4541 TaxID=2831522 RepID=UPI001BAA64F2|nr:glycosyltransferase family 2 protein [Paenibacillus sp. Marseille-Q4541]